MDTMFYKIFLAGFLVFIVYHAIRFNALVKKGVALSDATVPFSRISPGAPMRILIAGDSSAVGVGASDPAFSTAGRFGALYPHAEIVNIGVNGLRLAGLDAKLDNLPAGTFDLVVLQIGANDITHRTPSDAVERDLRSVLAKAKKLSEKVLVLHTGDLGRAPIWPPLIGAYISANVRRIRDIYLRVVPLMGALYVDLYGARIDDIFATDLYRYYAEDLFHLSGDGYGVWFDEIKKVLQGVKSS